MPLPLQNRYFRINEEITKKAEMELHKGVLTGVWQLSIPQSNGKKQIIYQLQNINKRLEGAANFGLPVRPIDPTLFDDLAEAIDPYQRAGVESEIRRILEKLLTSCGIPESVFEK